VYEGAAERAGTEGLGRNGALWRWLDQLAGADSVTQWVKAQPLGETWQAPAGAAKPVGRADRNRSHAISSTILSPAFGLMQASTKKPTLAKNSPDQAKQPPARAATPAQSPTAQRGPKVPAVTRQAKVSQQGKQKSPPYSDVRSSAAGGGGCGSGYHPSDVRAGGGRGYHPSDVRAGGGKGGGGVHHPTDVRASAGSGGGGVSRGRDSWELDGLVQKLAAQNERGYQDAQAGRNSLKASSPRGGKGKGGKGGGSAVETSHGPNCSPIEPTDPSSSSRVLVIGYWHRCKSYSLT
jgi:hypothetical protein